MPREKITDELLNTILHYPDKDKEIFDTLCNNFRARYRNGTISFCFVYPYYDDENNRKEKRITIGKYDDINTVSARTVAYDYQKEYDNGNYPEIKKTKKVAGKDVVVNKKKITKKTNPKTLAQGLQRWLEDEAIHFKSYRSYELAFEKIDKSILKMKLSSIKEDDIEQHLEMMKEKRQVSYNTNDGKSQYKRTVGGLVAAKKHYVYLSQAIAWLHKKRYIPENIMQHVDKPKASINHKKRYLNSNELRALFSVLKPVPYPLKHIMLLCLYTGQRKGEVMSMKWDDIDTEINIWQIKETKNNRVHYCYLSKRAREVLASIPVNIRAKSEFVFPQKLHYDKPISGIPHKAFKGLRQQVEEIIQEKFDNGEIQKIEKTQFTIHDLRRTLSTTLSKLGHNQDDRKIILNHDPLSWQGVAAVYDAHDYYDLRKECMEKYADYVERFIPFENPTNDNEDPDYLESQKFKNYIEGVDGD